MAKDLIVKDTSEQIKEEELLMLMLKKGIIKQKKNPSSMYDEFFLFLNDKNWENFMKLFEEEGCLTPKYINHRDMDGISTPLGRAFHMNINGYPKISKDTKSGIILKFMQAGGSLDKAFDPTITALTPLNVMLSDLEDYTHEAVMEIIKNINPLEKVSHCYRTKFKDLCAEIAPELTKILLGEIMPTVLVEMVTEYSAEPSGVTIETVEE